MACGTNTGVQSGIQGEPAAIDIHCLQATNGVPLWTPAIDQLPFAYDSNTDTVYFFSCESNSWTVISGSFSLCGLNPVDLNVLNPNNICSTVMVPVTYDLGGQCVQGHIPFSELADRLDFCNPAVPPSRVISSNASITVTESINPTTGQRTYDLADNGIANVSLSGPDANGVYTLTATYEDGTTQPMTIDTEIADVDTWTNVTDNGDGTFSATMPNGNIISWAGDTGTPPPATTNTRLDNPTLTDTSGDGISDVVRWDIVDDIGTVVGTVDAPIFHPILEERDSHPVVGWVNLGSAAGIHLLDVMTYTNTHNFPVRCSFYNRLGYVRFDRTASGGMYFECQLYTETSKNGVSIGLNPVYIQTLRLDDERGHNNALSINHVGGSSNTEETILMPGDTMECRLSARLTRDAVSCDISVFYDLQRQTFEV